MTRSSPAFWPLANRIAILSGIPYLFSMVSFRKIRWIRASALAVLLLVAAVSCRARGEVSDDSIFSAYRHCVKSGDTTAAIDILQHLSRTDSTVDAQLANFALAWRAHEQNDTARLIDYLDRGIPTELSDHGVWLRVQSAALAADSLRMMKYWEVLAADTTSVFVVDALYELGLDALRKRDLSRIERVVARARSLSTSQRQHAFDLLLADGFTAAERHREAVGQLSILAIEYPHPLAGRVARDKLNEYEELYGFKPAPQSNEELTRELFLLSEYGKHEWGLSRVEDEFSRNGWQQHNDLLLFYKGRFESGLGRHEIAVRELKNHRAAYPQSAYKYSTLLYLGRSAYLSDDDQTAISVLTAVAVESGDTVLVNRACELLGMLYTDLQRPQEAASFLQRWVTMSSGLPSHADALWRFGWSLWECGDYRGAREAWSELAALNLDSEYAPASMYWIARAAERIGEREESNRLFAKLDSSFTYSYYALAQQDNAPASAAALPLIPPTLDELCVAAGPHTRKFGMLAALRLVEPALREWPLALRELQDSPGFYWWKAQLQYWNGDRLDAWRTIRANLGAYLRTPGVRPADFYPIVYPLDHVASVKSYSAERSLDPYFVLGVICQESHFEAEIVSAAGAIGMMQLMPATAAIEARKLGIEHATSKLYSADHNVRLGVVHLSELMSEFGGDTVLVLAAYNAGKDVTRRWQAEFGSRPRDEFIERIPYRETRLFVKRIMEHTAAYRRLYPDLNGSIKG